MAAGFFRQCYNAGNAETWLRKRIGVRRNRWSGNRSGIRRDLRSGFDMLKAAGISYRTAGENIAKGQKNAEAVMNGWMNSAGHRSNILSSSYSRIGVGYAEDKNGTPLWVQIFAG